MAQLWYYVSDGDRVGPVAQKEIIELIKSSKLDLQSYVWRKGFADWMHIEDVNELTTAVETEIEPEEEVNLVEESDDVEEISIEEPESLDIEENIEVAESVDEAHDEVEPEEELETANVEEVVEIEEQVEDEPLRFSDFNLSEEKFYIKTGSDRGSASGEYGPFSFDQLKVLLNQKRINDLTLIFSMNMKHWAPVGVFEDFETLFMVKTTISDEDRRQFLRKPFVARMLYANNNEVFEGLCRDLSVGGMQVLMDHFPGATGEQISLNVHPENSEHHFVADGKVVRILEGRKGFSFRFINLSEEAKQSIENYIASEEN